MVEEITVSVTESGSMTATLGRKEIPVRPTAPITKAILPIGAVFPKEREKLPGKSGWRSLSVPGGFPRR
jgi:hypothetical protein